MVIYIDKTIGQHCKGKRLTEQEEALFSELAVAHRNGYCFLCGDFISIEYLMSNTSGLIKSQYKKVYSHLSELRAIMAEVEQILVISYQDAPLVPQFMVNKARLIKVQDALGFRLGAQCTLLGENLVDCRFYQLIASWYMHSRRIKGVETSFHEEQGGGNTTGDVFKKCFLVDRVPTLCIVDNDIKFGKTKEYPQPPALGDTAKKAIDAFAEISKQCSLPLFDLYCLPVHEAENLLPTNLLVQLSVNPNAMMVFIRKLSKISNGEPILYYDFKEGDKRIKKNQAIQYWLGIAEITGESQFPCLINSALDRALVSLEEKDSSGIPRIHNTVVDSHLVALWNTIGKKVFSWGCSSPVTRS